MARVSRALLGDSLTAIRVAPALASALIVLLTGVASSVMAEMIGEADSMHERERPRALSWVPWSAMIAVFTSPVFLRPGNLFQPVVFDQLWWTAALLALLMRAYTRDVRWWIAVGAALGLGLLTKFSIAFVGVGIVAGALFAPTRRDLLTRWPWLALLLALAIGSPSLVGQWLLAFGAGTKPGRIVLALGESKADLEPFMTHCDELRRIGTPLGVEEERSVPITRCVGPKSPLQMLWPILDPSHE